MNCCPSKLLLGLAVALSCCGCGGSQPPAKPTMQVSLVTSPSPPTVGETEVVVVLAEPSGEPVAGAQVKLEGNMNHAGMTPSFAELSEAAPGKYTGTLNLTMGGDWFVLVDVETPDGTSVQQKIDLPGVKAQ